MLILLIVLGIIGLGLSQDKEPFYHVRGNLTLKHNHTYIQNIDDTKRIFVRGFQMDYNVTFVTGKCCAACGSSETCPWLLIYCGHTIIQKRQCMPSEREPVEDSYNNLNVLMHRKAKNTTCVSDMQTGTTTCFGTRYALFTPTRDWNISLLHNCDYNHTLDITFIDIKLYHLNESAPQPFTHRRCSSYLNYNMTIMPNLIGNINVNTIQPLIFEIASEKFRDCYKYTKDLVCLYIYPQINKNNGRIYLPCLQLWDDFSRGCKAVFAKYQFGYDQSWYSNNTSECYYREVLCENLDTKQFKGVKFRYTNKEEQSSNHKPGDTVFSFCMTAEGYTYDSGDPKRVCQYTGKWSGIPFRCRPKPKLNPLVIGLPVGGVLLVGLLVSVIVAVKVKKIWITSDYMPIPKDDKCYRYDSFICYSEQDEVKILDMCQKLESEEHGMILCIHRRDFNPGGHISLNIDGAIKQSRSAIIVLSRNFLKSGWCKKEFDVAITQQSHTPGYKVVVVCLDDPADFNDEDVSMVPTYIMRFINCRTYLQFNCQHFMQRLEQCLPTPDLDLRDERMRRGEANLVQIGTGSYGTISTVTESGSIQEVF